MKSQKFPHQEIARLTGLSIHTVTSYVRAYKQGGLEKLKSVRFSKPQSQLCTHTSTLESYFLTHPPATIKEAVNSITELTGIKRSATQVRTFLKSRGLKRRKVGMIPAKADIQQQEQFKKKT